ncbi:C-terminal binding protein [Lapillicoccus sp.]|uniref:C-terminal binding protein n=1 Tax=Lapillicoccus sp. TaxID=1909287 RepID=UPI0032673321
MTTVVQVENVGVLAPYNTERRALAAAGVYLEVARCRDAADLVAQAAGADVIWLEWRPLITRSVLEGLPRCGLVMRWGVGYEQVDVAAATDLGVAVANSPGHCTEDVAEHALALMLAVTRQVVDDNRRLVAGGWGGRCSSHRRLQDCTVGVVGLGRIGRRVAQLCAAFGADVIGHDPLVSDVPGVRTVDLAELLRRSDIVSLHVPDTPSSRGLIDAPALASMKDAAVLVNTGRGGVVDEDALLAELRAERLWAALDVFATEPLPLDHPFRGAPQTVLTGHNGASSDRSLEQLRAAMCSTTLEWLSTGWAATIVNPEVRGRTRPSAVNPRRG